VLNLMKLELNNRDVKPIIVDFNPWFFTTEEQVIERFFDQFSSAIRQSNQGKSNNLSRKLKSYADKVASVTVKLGLVEFSVREMLSVFGNDSTIFGLRDEIKALLRETGQRIVVFIDDLDRLDEHEIQTMFKLVKLIADFPYTSYVLAFDPTMVSAAIRTSYPTNDDRSIGESFLEKIIQVPLHVPPADQKLLTPMVFEGLNEIIKNHEIALSQEEIERFANVWGRTISNILSTPRIAKRYLNTVSVLVPLLCGEVNTVDQLLLEAVSLFFPRLYDLIRHKPDLVLSGGRDRLGRRSRTDEYKQEIENQGMQSLSPEELDAAKTILEEIFPRTSSYWSNTHYDDQWNATWERQKRICSETYFPRYFKFAVPSGDISDVAFDEFMQTLQNAVNRQTIIDELLKLSGVRGLPRLIQKLRRIETLIKPDISEKIALALAHMGQCFTKADAYLPGSLGSTWQQAAVLISRLVENTDEERRVVLSRQITADAVPLPFALETFRFLREKDKDGTYHNEDDISRGSDVLISRIRAEASSADILENYGKESVQLLGAWSYWGSGEEVTQVVRGWIAEDGIAEQFLELFSPTAVSMTTGRRIWTPIEREEYDGINKIIPADELAKIFEEKYPDLAQENETLDWDEVPLMVRSISSFLRLHKMVMTNENVNENEE
jgi:predicted KAP-like P-loop ATPase